MHGYEAVMIDLGLLHGLSSVSEIWRELTSPKAIKILPFRVAWVYGGEAWDENWKHVEIALKAKSLKWRNFSDLDEAEKWLGLSRHEALAE